MSNVPDFEEEDILDEPEERRAASCHELLFDFLYKVRQHHRQPELEYLFSPSFNLEEALQAAQPYTVEEVQKFKDATDGGLVVVGGVNYVHNQDIVSCLSGNAKTYCRRALQRIPSDVCVGRHNCQQHLSECALSKLEQGLVCFLNSSAKDFARDTIPLVAPVDEADTDPVLELDPEQERIMSEQVSLEEMRAHGTLVHEEEDFSLEENDERVPVPVLPSFPFGDKQYVLLTDIQNVFEIREDYCLAIIAQNLEQADNFIDSEEMSKYSLIDSAVKDSEYMDAAQTLSMIFADAKRYEESLPTEEEFMATQARLGLTEMGRDTAGGSVAVDDKSVDLWNKKTLVEDENQKLFVYVDNFLLRGSGSRLAGMGKDSALSNYIHSLKFPEFICLHSKFSHSSIQFSMFAIKVLSKYLGGYPVRMNADKIMLIERQMALDIFGQGPGVYAMRSKYYLTYAAYGLACGVKDPNLLKDYGKRELLRYGRPRIVALPAIEDAAESSRSRERPQIEETQTDAPEGDQNEEEQIEEPSTKRPRID